MSVDETIQRDVSGAKSDYAEACDQHQGWCVTCQDWTHDSAEPDARKYLCPVCAGRTVYGAEEAAMRGYITVD